MQPRAFCTRPIGKRGTEAYPLRQALSQAQLDFPKAAALTSEPESAVEQVHSSERYHPAALNMSLSDEAIIGLIGLLLTCAPLAAFIYRAKFRRPSNDDDLNYMMVPKRRIPSTREAIPSYMQDIELGKSIEHAVVSSCPLSYWILQVLGRFC